MNTMVKKIVEDQLLESVHFSFPPKRIVSLVPSQTELLADLGLEQEVVGITKFCVHPTAWVRSKTIVGGTKKFWFDAIDELNPDLIIGNKEENYKEGINQLKKKYPVWMSDIITFEDSLSMITSLGIITDKVKESAVIIHQIQNSFSGLKKANPQTVLYLIWRKPWMAAGSDTFIHTLLEKMGLENILKDTRYPELKDNDIKKLSPAVIFLSSEPYPFNEQHIEELKQLCPLSKIVLVDGEMFSWYGSRLIQAPAYFNSLTPL